MACRSRAQVSTTPALPAMPGLRGTRHLRLQRIASEHILEQFPLDRLFQNRSIGKPAVDALSSIPCHEYERNSARRQKICDGVHKFAAEIDVEYRGFEVALV